MKLHKISLLMLGAVVFAASCDDIDEQQPAGGTLTAEQVQETNALIPSRTDASFSALFPYLGKPRAGYPGSTRADDFAFISAGFSADLEASDVAGSDNDYNWFSTASELSTRTATYANPFMRYCVPYCHIGMCNDIIANAEGAEDAESINKVAQARAIRAFDYMALAPYFQFSILVNPDAPCVPILRDGVDYGNNPRASVKEVWEYIVEDLNLAIENLEGYDRQGDKTKVDQNVAYGLRARANLALGNWAEAAADAQKAQEGYTPASIEEVSTPSFYDINDHNWIWGIQMTRDMVLSDAVRTSCSWISSFSSKGYATACQTYAMINKILYDKISSTDVRKGWWVDEDLYSPLLETIYWDDKTGADISTYETEEKAAFLPYTNVKFGMKSGIGATTNDNDWPLMRVEEMILIEAEGLAKSGNEAQAKTILENFVKTYRDPNYTVNPKRLLADEIWFQRRVELWCEGFGTSDIKRLNKPVVRFHGEGTSNFDDNFTFNIAADDGWLNMRFPQTEIDNNKAIVDNEGGKQPVKGQNPDLLDGVTDPGM